MQKQRAQEILDSFTGRRILVLGDVMLDEYVWGHVSRVSPEAPVMVVDADSHTFVPGGAANVVNNICALGGQAAIVGLVGHDSAGRTLSEKLHEEGADVTGLMTSETRPTTQKTRIIAHSQQVVRVDHEKRDPINSDEEAQVLAYLETAIPYCEALLLSDYQKGLLGRDLVSKAIEAANGHGKVSTGNLKPQGIGGHCHLTVITLNPVKECCARQAGCSCVNPARRIF
jgi:rfaE bifunctional protein kinase chain/domain